MRMFQAGMVFIGLFVMLAYPLVAAEPAGVQFGINSFLGNITQCEVPILKPASEDRTHYLDAVRDLGVTTIRETFANWVEIEPERGKGYRLEPFDDLAKKASDRGIEIVALAYPFPTWATGVKLTSEQRSLPKREFEGDFRRFVRMMAVRYGGQRPESLLLKLPIRKWIFSNELDTTFSPDEYAFWLKAFCEEVKAADAGAKVSTMGLGDPVLVSFLPRLLESKNLQGPSYPYFDVVCYHVYPYTFSTTSIYGMNVAQVLTSRYLREHKVNAELWLTETGSPDPQDQPDLAIKAVVHAASTGVRRVHLHGLWDICGQWGVLADTPSGQVPVRKPLFVAYQTFVRMIGQNQGVQFLGPGRYRALLPGGKAVHIVWSEGPNTGVPEFLKGRIRVTDLQGKRREINVGELTLTGHPLFVEQ